MRKKMQRNVYLTYSNYMGIQLHNGSCPIFRSLEMAEIMKLIFVGISAYLFLPISVIASSEECTKIVGVPTHEKKQEVVLARGAIFPLRHTYLCCGWIY